MFNYYLQLQSKQINLGMTEETDQFKSKQQYYSYALVLASCFFWVSGYLYSNNNNLTVFQTSMLRGFTLTLGCLAICKYKGQPVDFKNEIKLLTLRNFLMTLCGMMMAWSQFYLPLSITHTLLGTGCLFIFLLEYLLDNKPATRAQITGMGISFVGILLVANGGSILQALTGKEFQSDFQNYKSENPLVMLLFCGLLILSQLSWAYTVLLTNKVNCTPFQMNFQFGAICFIWNSLLYTVSEQRAPAPIFYEGIFWTGICLFLAELTFVGSIMLSVHIGRTMIVSFMTVVISYLYSIFMYGEPVNWVCILGSASIVYGISRIILV